MKICEHHWSLLRQKISDKGLDHLVASDGRVALAQSKDQIETKEVTRDNFDPLMQAHWAIVGNAMDTLERAGINPIYLFGDTSKAPEGRNDCPLCELNYLHRTNCTNPKCVLDKENGYDWFLDRAVEDSLEKARELKLIGLPS